MQRSLGLVQVDEIYFTHFHADHFLGLPGLLKTYDLTERERPLTIYGPRGLRDLIQSLGRVIGRVGYKLDLVELEAGDAIPRDGGEIRSFPVEHSVRAFGYALVEADRPGRFDPEAAKRLGVEEGPDFAALQRGESVSGSSGPVEPGEVMGEPRPGRTIAITGDTAPCRATVEAAQRRGPPHPRRQLRRGGGAARRRYRPLDRRPGGSRSPRGRSQAPGPGPHLLPLPRRQSPGGGARGLRADLGAPRLRPDRDPLPGARGAFSCTERHSGAGGRQPRGDRVHRGAQGKHAREYFLTRRPSRDPQIDDPTEPPHQRLDGWIFDVVGDGSAVVVELGQVCDSVDRVGVLAQQVIQVIRPVSARRTCRTLRSPLARAWKALWRGARHHRTCWTGRRSSDQSRLPYRQG